MPTGSLCAERNAIGTALAADLSLRRRDLCIVAVYSFPTIGKSGALTEREYSMDVSLSSPRSNAVTSASKVIPANYVQVGDSLIDPSSPTSASGTVVSPGNKRKILSLCTPDELDNDRDPNFMKISRQSGLHMSPFLEQRSFNSLNSY
jgi:hypothetical protein